MVEETSDATPVENIVTQPYSCGECGCIDCKLWRQSHTFACEVRLFCWRCLEAKGYAIEYGQPHGSDQVYDRDIGPDNWVPAVPDLDGSWWGYTSVPNWWCAWWAALPNHKDDCTWCGGSGKVADREYECFRCEGSGRRSV